MGQWTTFCILSGNPTNLSNSTNNNKYKWQEKVRVILKNGNITNIGKCNLGGEFTFDTKNKSLFSFLGKKEGYRVADSSTLFLFNETFNAQGFVISDLVYKYLKKNKSFNECIKNKNLFELLKAFIPKNKLLSKYVGNQNVFIDNKDRTSKKYLWQLISPESKTKEGVKNKKRIEKIINNFIKFSCKNSIKKNIKNKKFIIKRYELKDNKSSKFWTIKYNKDGEFTTSYGKIGTEGRKSKKKILSNEGIKKLIESKIKKGYKLKK